MILFLLFVENIRSLTCGNYEYTFDGSVVTLTNQNAGTNTACDEFKSRSDISKVIVEDLVTSLDDYLFEQNTRLSEVEIHVGLSIIMLHLMIPSLYFKNFIQLSLQV